MQITNNSKSNTVPTIKHTSIINSELSDGPVMAIVTMSEPVLNVIANGLTLRKILPTIIELNDIFVEAKLASKKPEFQRPSPHI